MDIVIVHAAATWVMFGVIALVQLVHYPSFLYVPAERFLEFERFHQARISFIVVPAMLLEAGTAVLLFREPRFQGDPLFLLSLGLLLLVWLSTALLQGPLHGKLEKAYDETLILRLIRWNWLRTIGWGFRAVVIGHLL